MIDNLPTYASVSLSLPEELSLEEWKEIGVKLGQLERGVQWWIGEWWAFGEHRYGDRKAIVTAPDWQGPSFQTCADAAMVCRKFETSRRHEVLTFKHHREVAALPVETQDRLLDAAETNGWSTRELRAEVSQIRASAPIASVSAPPGAFTTADLGHLVATGAKFGAIYADPPWLYDNQRTRAATSNHYAGLTVDELCEMPVRELAADAAHLHLWTTNAFLFDCPKIFDAWGFEFRSSFVWVKDQMGIGNYWRNSHELMLTAVRGDAKRFNDHSMMSWLECERGKHSAKPEQVRDMIKRASPGPYLEMFGRSPVDGWTVFGNDPALFGRSLLVPHAEVIAA